eukprot:gnl/Ergobibamus_cyprinoides/627.p1 GENE.gnl/Ergobibamus_cyprinoides/627~~gnl/Ergobibamus_cyprinoides/627.p1  ORF type:complete len:196 (+),score=43.35 gnl/Ergobibamus_cyprinoides/627:240-827(+)
MSASCVTSLAETPFLCESIEDVEFVCFERVSPSLRHFDMTLVHRDITNFPPTTITSIEVQHLPKLRMWADTVDLPFLELPDSINWSATIQKYAPDAVTYSQFLKLGGWRTVFFGAAADEEDGSSESTQDGEEAWEASSSLDAASDDVSSDDAFEASSDAGPESLEDEGVPLDQLGEASDDISDTPLRAPPAKRRR